MSLFLLFILNYLYLSISRVSMSLSFSFFFLYLSISLSVSMLPSGVRRVVFVVGLFPLSGKFVTIAENYLIITSPTPPTIA